MDGDPRQMRRYLFLQGMATPFFAQLGAKLAERGHVVKRINFTAGDRLFWRLPGSVAYRGNLTEWPRTLEMYLNEWRITDVILFGDWRPLHAVAIRIARLRGLTVHVFEEGYIRPNWVTLEQGGVNKNSSLPRDPAWFRSAARSLPPWHGGSPVYGSFTLRASWDVLYHGWTWLWAWRYPGYRTHLPIHPFVDYACWIKRFARAPAARKRTDAALQALVACGRPYYLVPLQLDSDSQLRINSSFGSLVPAIDTIIASFARHAPPETALLLKEHPLDNQRTDWEAQAMATAERLGVRDRIFYVAHGDVGSLMQRSRGVVTVNSTSGMQALALGVPIVALAQPIYHMPGLTFQGGLDRFWCDGEAPDAALVDDFRRVVADRALINGDFFSKEGLALAVANTIARLEIIALEPGWARMSLTRAALALPPDDAITEQGGAD